MENQQLSLQIDITPKTSLREEGLVMSADALMQWKHRIFNYQNSVREKPAPQQNTIIDLASKFDPEGINPFRLHLQSMAFYRMPDEFGQSALYFVIDSAASILLYIGETCRSNKRWKGVHDCKSYVDSYLALNYRYQMQADVNIGFYFEVPDQRKPRQQLEQQLIRKWRSPFNKEMWDLWGQPFKAVK